MEVIMIDNHCRYLCHHVWFIRSVIVLQFVGSHTLFELMVGLHYFLYVCKNCSPERRGFCWKYLGITC